MEHVFVASLKDHSQLSSSRISHFTMDLFAGSRFQYPPVWVPVWRMEKNRCELRMLHWIGTNALLDYSLER